jgi:single-strand DNA-binding protein
MTTRSTRADGGARTTTSSAHRNEVLLLGRISGEPAVRLLPSGDEIVSFRLVVERPPRTASDGRREPSVDTLDCAAVAAVVRRRVLGWQSGDVVEVSGALRRRFWRSGPAVLSRCEVQVVRARRVERAA